MQIAITLLLSAMSLLTQINSTPNISPELKLKAENVANFAIDYANNVINEQAKSVQPEPQSIQNFGSITQNTCIENPVLSIATSTFEVTEVDYSTGCPINPSTTWSYTNGAETNSGTIGTGSNVWYVGMKTNNDIFKFSIYKQLSLHSITVGTTTKNF